MFAATHWRTACRWPDVALAGVCFNVIVLVSAPLARPDLDLLQKALSYYAIGPWGMLQAAAFVALAIASVALGAALWRTRSASRWMRLAARLLILGGIGSLGLVVFPMGRPGPTTVIGDAHQTAGTVGGIVQLASALAFVLAVRHDPVWRGRVVLLAVAVAVAIIGAIATQTAIWWPEIGVPMGAAMRLAVVPLVGLWGVVALRLRQRCGRSATRSGAAR